MSDKKNIERLFQEKFKDFEMNPTPEVWENIESRLEKKENKRRIVPFWFNAKATGIAAALILGFFGLNNYSNWNLFSNDSVIDNTEIPTGNSSTYHQNEINNNQNSTNNSPSENSRLNQSEAVANQNHSNTSGSSTEANVINSSSEQKLVSSSKNKIKTSQNAVLPSSSAYSENAISNINKLPSKYNKIISAKEKSNVISNPVAEKSVAVSGVKSNKNSLKDKNVIPAEEESNVISNPVAEKSVAVSEIKSNKNSIVNESKFSSNDNEVIAPEQNPKGITNHVTEKSIVVSEVKSNENPIANVNKQSRNSDDVISSKQNSKGITNISIEQTANVQEIIAKDSTVVAIVEENPLEKILREKELKVQDEKKIAEQYSKWKVRPNVAPIFMNSSNGSPIDGQFSDNSKEFNNSFSLGLGVDYAVSSKISLRTGISKFDLGYNTNEIVYYKDLNAKGTNSSRLKTIKMRPGMEGLVIEDKKVSKPAELAFQNKDDGYLSQQMSYMEVPVEVSYKLLDRKFGIQFITGVSTLFLNDNKVSVMSNGLSTTVGEANNLNKVHFSTNIGLGFKYSFWKSFEANFEPTFKYQINTFNENSGGFKPYIIGLYSGLSYKF